MDLISVNLGTIKVKWVKKIRPRAVKRRLGSAVLGFVGPSSSNRYIIQCQTLSKPPFCDYSNKHEYPSMNRSVFQPQIDLIEALTNPTEVVMDRIYVIHAISLCSDRRNQGIPRPHDSRKHIDPKRNEKIHKWAWNIIAWHNNWVQSLNFSHL